MFSLLLLHIQNTLYLSHCTQSCQLPQEATNVSEIFLSYLYSSETQNKNYITKTEAFIWKCFETIMWNDLQMFYGE